jgi:hypothetical protein
MTASSRPGEVGGLRRREHDPHRPFAFVAGAIGHDERDAPRADALQAQLDTQRARIVDGQIELRQYGIVEQLAPACSVAATSDPDAPSRP